MAGGNTTTAMLRRTQLGLIAVETATLVIADPTFLDIRSPEAEDGIPESRLLRFASRQDGIGWGAVIRPTGLGDGAYPVYLEESKTEWGVRPLRVVVEFFE